MSGGCRSPHPPQGGGLQEGGHVQRQGVLRAGEEARRAEEGEGSRHHPSGAGPALLLLLLCILTTDSCFGCFVFLCRYKKKSFACMYQLRQVPGLFFCLLSIVDVKFAKPLRLHPLLPILQAC